MSAVSRRVLIGITAGLLATLLAGVIIAALPILPFQYQRAHQRWRQQGLQHYEVEVTWANGWSFGHALVEIRNNRLVSGKDLDTGQPIGAPQMLSASYFASIDNLFNIVDQRVQPDWNWRNLLARYAPALASRIDPCVAPLSEVRYDPQLGYPAEIWYNDSWCAKTFFNYSHVKVISLKPLP
jgi:hypothetical protein